jgi:hypothetical protein
MCCCYLPPCGSTNYEGEQNGIEILYDTIINVTAKYTDTHIILVGDLNARTAAEPDYIQDDNAAYIPGGNFYCVSDFDIKRTSCDKEVNIFGEHLLEICKSLDIHIVNGRAPSDQTGQMTFISSRGASVIDYFVVSSQLFPVIKDMYVVPNDITNHLPVLLYLNSKNPPENPCKVIPRNKFVWKPELCDNVCDRLKDLQTEGHVNFFNNMLTLDNIDGAVLQIENIYNYIAREMKVKSSNTLSYK